jgi:hypothetical protein
LAFSCSWVSSAKHFPALNRMFRAYLQMSTVRHWRNLVFGNRWPIPLSQSLILQASELERRHWDLAKAKGRFRCRGVNFSVSDQSSWSARSRPKRSHQFNQGELEISADLKDASLQCFDRNFAEYGPGSFKLWRAERPDLSRSLRRCPFFAFSPSPFSTWWV